MANNIQRYKDIRDEAHANIELGYEQAIRNYGLQRTQFMEQLKIEKKSAMKKVMKEINKEIYSSSSEDINKTMDAVFIRVKSYLEESIVNVLEGRHLDDLDTIKAKLDSVKTKKENPQTLFSNMSTAIKSDIENLLTQNDFTRLSLIKYIQKSGIKLGGESNKSLQDNLFGYLRRLIIQRYTSNEAIKNLNIDLTSYKNSLKGYLQEEAIETALQDILLQYGYTARQTGAVESDTGQEIIYDLILGPKYIKDLDNNDLRQLIRQMDLTQNIAAEGNSSLPEEKNFLGGIQSKSWINPAKGDPSFISFGNHSSLIPTDDRKYYWHGGVSVLMSNMTNVIGEKNFLFATGSELSFTVDLLVQLRERAYVLNFHKSKGKAISSGHVYADIHNDKD